MPDGQRRAWVSPFVAGFAAAVLGLVVVGGVAVVASGLSSRPDPSAVEVRLARFFRRFAVPADLRARKNPVRLDVPTLVSGREHFADHCATCHGNDGSGRTPLGRGLFPRPPDMRAAPTQAMTDGELFYAIENGIRFSGMPAFGSPGREEESWQLVHFIRHLPSLTEAERAEMELLNPRSPREWQEMREEQEFLRGAPPSPGKPAKGHGH